MTKNPFINAFSAALYITVVASMMFYGPKIAGLIDDKDNVLAPITMLSILVLSAAVMGYLFFLQPIQLYLDGEKKLAVNLFTKTLVIFLGITILLLLALFSRVLS